MFTEPRDRLLVAGAKLLEEILRLMPQLDKACFEGERFLHGRTSFRSA
jgi:hypothetical protein